jgi:hypothetical protein
MRYLNDDLNQPWPLHERLWEARRGLFVGLLMSALPLGLIVGALWVIAEFERSASSGTHYGHSGLYFLQRCWPLIVVIALRTVWIVWQREVDLVSRASHTLEQVVENRLRAIEQRTPPSFESLVGSGTKRNWDSSGTPDGRVSP